MKKLFVFGNEYLENDKYAHQVINHLENIEITKCRSPEDLLEEEGNILILDVVKNLEEPVLIEDLSVLKDRKMISLHDFDLNFFLKLLKEIGLEKDIKIIGIPEKGNPKATADKIKKWI